MVVSRRRRGLVGVVVVVSLVTACGATHRATPAPTGRAPTAPPSAPSTVPTVASPVGARLAIGTPSGMELWSAATGIFTVGPAMDDVEVSDVTWSPDGRYLSWQTVPLGGHRRGAELWLALVATGATTHWGPLAAGDTYGAVVVGPTGVLALRPDVTLYAPGRSGQGRTVAVPAVGPSGASVQSWAGGWVVEPTGSPTGQRVERLGTNGAVLPPPLVLDAGTSHGPYFDLGSVSADGASLAVELGDHGTGCEHTGVAELWTAALGTGTQMYSTPPAPGPRLTQRFWDIDTSGPAGTVYASTFACTTTGRATDTVLWRFAHGAWHRMGRDEVAADQDGTGPVATLSGTVQVTHGVAAVSGPGEVAVAGRVIAGGGEAIAWDPLRATPGG